LDRFPAALPWAKPGSGAPRKPSARPGFDPTESSYAVTASKGARAGRCAGAKDVARSEKSFRQGREHRHETEAEAHRARRDPAKGRTRGLCHGGDAIAERVAARRRTASERLARPRPGADAAHLHASRAAGRNGVGRPARRHGKGRGAIRPFARGGTGNERQGDDTEREDRPPRSVLTARRSRCGPPHRGPAVGQDTRLLQTVARRRARTSAGETARRGSHRRTRGQATWRTSRSTTRRRERRLPGS
jgi:hypothetical protein